MSEKKSDKELTDDEETLEYFKHLAVDEDDVPDRDISYSDTEWDHVKSLITSRTDEEGKDARQAFLDELTELEYQRRVKEFLPRRLQEFRPYLDEGLEGRWIVHIWNRVIDTKLILQEEYGKYKKTKSSSKVGSYAEFKKKFKNKRSRQATELKVRKIAFYALDMSVTDPRYNAADWTSFIQDKPDPAVDYDDMIDAITIQLNDGFKI